MANAENQGLLDMFAAECGGHLDAMRAQLASLAGAGNGNSAAGRAAAAALSDTLHTLAGAARAVDLLDLEYLCRAVEDMLAAQEGRFDKEGLALIGAAVELAPQLLAPPTGRVRNQMLGLVARCAAAGAGASSAAVSP